MGDRRRERGKGRGGERTEGRLVHARAPRPPPQSPTPTPTTQNIRPRGLASSSRTPGPFVQKGFLAAFRCSCSSAAMVRGEEVLERGDQSDGGLACLGACAPGGSRSRP